MASIIQALGALPFLGLAAFTAGLAVAPALYVLHHLQLFVQTLPEYAYYPGMGISLVMAYVTYGFSLMLIAPALNAVLGGRLKPYRGKQVSLGAIPWYVHATLTLLPRMSFLGWVCPTPFLNLYYRLMGMRMGDGVTINTTAIADPSLIELGEKVTLGGSCSLMGHYAQGGFLVLAPTKVGDRATIGLRAIVMGGVEVGERAKVLAGSFVLPKTIIPPGETWGGIPAAKIDLRQDRHEA